MIPIIIPVRLVLNSINCCQIGTKFHEFQVAEAPNIQINRVATIRELDQELNKHSALMMLDNKIDLKCLTRVGVILSISSV